MGGGPAAASCAVVCVCACVKLYLYSECEYILATRESAVVQLVKYVNGITGRAWLSLDVRKKRRRESEKEKERRESEKREVGGVCGGDCGVGVGGGKVRGARCT